MSEQLVLLKQKRVAIRFLLLFFSAMARKVQSSSYLAHARTSCSIIVIIIIRLKFVSVYQLHFFYFLHEPTLCLSVLIDDIIIMSNFKLINPRRYCLMLDFALARVVTARALSVLSLLQHIMLGK